MNREERYTTVTLTINGESAKKTLEELTARANALGEQISALRSGERSAESGEAGNVQDTAAEVRRLEGELARVLGEIEAIERGAESVEGVMSRIVRHADEKKGLSFFGGKYHLPDWFVKKYKGGDVNVSGMSPSEMAELYRILSEIKSEVRGYGLEVRGGDSGEVRGKSGEEVHRNEGRGTGDERALSEQRSSLSGGNSSAAAWRIDGGVIKVEMVNGKTLEIKDEEQLERIIGQLMDEITDYKRLAIDWQEKNGYSSDMKPDKFRVENDWKLGKDTENYIAMSTGVIDYKEYLERAREIEAEYLRMKIVNAKSTETEIYQFRNELLNLQVKVYRPEIS